MAGVDVLRTQQTAALDASIRTGTGPTAVTSESAESTRGRGSKIANRHARRVTKVRARCRAQSTKAKPTPTPQPLTTAVAAAGSASEILHSQEVIADRDFADHCRWRCLRPALSATPARAGRMAELNQIRMRHAGIEWRVRRMDDVRRRLNLAAG